MRPLHETTTPKTFNDTIHRSKTLKTQQNSRSKYPSHAALAASPRYSPTSSFGKTPTAIMLTRRFNRSINSLQSLTSAPPISKRLPSKYRASSRFRSSALVTAKTISRVMSHGLSAPQKSHPAMVHPEVDAVLRLHLARVLYRKLLANLPVQASLIGTLTHHYDTASITDIARRAAVLCLATLPPVRHHLREYPAAGHRPVVPAARFDVAKNGRAVEEE
ncbi:uncharacterized protein Triagg1_10686 [Trichoderma aggressivum f. europaeum]|uniref:Uncharacterized protein n=1 Tax=Trichoderma aggressivum f. europaeum TaxID=173218 RepID=A0AAE1I5I7_9HYPO|nr:hypothetical protein Triagg1_10686 [Trichoderma aggressivum f. europaeum]